MLSEVRVRDVALLESVDLSLGSGLNAISGETGEGKSLLLAAVGLLLGARARKSLVRSGCSQAVVEGRFLLDPLVRSALQELCDLVSEDAEEICLRRVLTAEGQSRAYLDGSLIPVGLLAKVGHLLVDVHGQGDQLSLKRPTEQGRVLDRYADAEKQRERWLSKLGDHRALRKERDALEEDRRQQQDRLDLIRFHLGELEALNPVAGELEALREEKARLSRAGELLDRLQEGVWELGEKDGSVADVLGRLAHSFPRGLGGSLDEIGERMDALAAEAEDLAGECRNARDGYEADPGRLDEVASRLSLYAELARRHRVEPEELAELGASLAAELEDLGDPDRRRAELDAALLESRSELFGLAKKLREKRSRAAKRLEKVITASLEGLRMPRARIQVEVAALPKAADFDPLSFGELGPGAGRFLVATNPGEPVHPLEEIASGGETARILLALRGALAGHHRVPLLIFDEIDSGIGGRVGLPFGRRVAEIAEHHQVLLITHLPQVAAFAEKHFVVRKKVKGKRTRTEVAAVAGEELVAELAAMLGGDTAQKAARAQARALLKEARGEAEASAAD